MNKAFLKRCTWIGVLFGVMCLPQVPSVRGDSVQMCGVPLPPTVAKVNNSEILREEVFLRLGDIATMSQDQRRLRCRGAVEEAIRAALLRPEAISYQVEVGPEDVKYKLASFRASFPSEEAFERFLSERGADAAVLRRVIEDGLLLKKIEERQIRSWHFSEELQQEYFEQHRAEIAKDLVKVGHLLVKTKEEAERILQERNLKNRSFSELAVKYSQDPESRDKGGELGWIERGKMFPEFDAAAFSLEIGSISKPVQTPSGWHLIQVEDKKPASEQTLEDHRSKVLRLLQEEEWGLQRADWWNELKQSASVWITPELISELQESDLTEVHAGQE